MVARIESLVLGLSVNHALARAERYIATAPTRSYCTRSYLTGLTSANSPAVVSSLTSPRRTDSVSDSVELRASPLGRERRDLCQRRAAHRDCISPRRICELLREADCLGRLTDRLADLESVIEFVQYQRVLAENDNAREEQDAIVAALRHCGVRRLIVVPASGLDRVYREFAAERVFVRDA